MRDSCVAVSVDKHVTLHDWKITVVQGFDMRNISIHFVSRTNWKTGRKRQVLHLVFAFRREQETNEHLFKIHWRRTQHNECDSWHPGILQGTLRLRHGRHRVHGKGACGKTAAIMPGRRHHLPVDEAEGGEWYQDPARRTHQVSGETWMIISMDTVHGVTETLGMNQAHSSGRRFSCKDQTLLLSRILLCYVCADLHLQSTLFC